jgi:large subunit ribosomal protein L15
VEKAGGSVTIPEIVPAAEKHAAKHRSVQKVIADKKAGKQG